MNTNLDQTRSRPPLRGARQIPLGDNERAFAQPADCGAGDPGSPDRQGLRLVDESVMSARGHDPVRDTVALNLPGVPVLTPAAAEALRRLIDEAVSRKRSAEMKDAA